VQVFLLHKHGQTIGKRILKIKIVRLVDGMNGGIVTNIFKRALPLLLVGLIPIIGNVVGILGPLMIFKDRKRQCLHDLIAGTIVVNA
jgi:uncharacterized RDD family membrane protein YckC